jgi:two-component system, cell cycle sensor histidine kinase DivJ
LTLVAAGTSVAPAADGPRALLGLVPAALYVSMLALQAALLLRARGSADRECDEVVPHGIADAVARHAADGTLLYASPAARMLFGTQPAELNGNGLFNRIHVADRAAYLRTLAEAAASGEARSVEFRVRRERADHDAAAETRFAWIEMSCAVARPPAAGRGQDIVAAMRNITEHKRREQALCDARDSAERANAAKTRSLAIMSHELRTPLNAIIGFSEMLENEPALTLDERKRREYAGLINDSGRHLLSVVNAILDASRIETGNFEITPEPFAPAPVVTGCCDLLALRARDAGVQLENLTPAGLPQMVADRRAVRQVLLNLLANAITFTAAGGRVTVRAQPEAGSIAFVVADNGAGIEAGDLARIGEPYFRVRAPYRHGSGSAGLGGAGLGLSIVRGLVRLHGGDLAIRSKIGEGTCVTVRLPLDCEQAKSARRKAAPTVAAVMRQPSSVAARPAVKSRRLGLLVKKSA